MSAGHGGSLTPYAASHAPGARGAAASLQGPPQGPPVASPRPDGPPAIRAPHPGEPAVYLTPRERPVLGLVSFGLTNAQIGRESSLPESVVRQVVAALLSKLAVPNRAALVGAGFRLGLLVPRPATADLMACAGSLSPQHAQLLPFAAEGLTDERIAARLSRPGASVKPAAVRSRMQTMRVRLRAVSREHAIRLSVEAGLLVVSPDGARLVLADPVGGAA